MWMGEGNKPRANLQNTDSKEAEHDNEGDNCSDFFETTDGPCGQFNEPASMPDYSKCLRPNCHKSLSNLV